MSDENQQTKRPQEQINEQSITRQMIEMPEKWRPKGFESLDTITTHLIHGW